MKHLNNLKWSLLFILLGGFQLVYGQDPHLSIDTNRALSTRTSPFAPPTDSDRSFSTDKSPKLDTGCIYRSSGPIVFDITIKRYLGPLNADGTLRNVQDLINKGVVSREVTLIMPAYDVDSNGGAQGVQPELDKISVNGFEVGFLHGTNNQWVNNSFKIPIDKIKFAQKGTNGSEPTGGINQIRIDIDTANTSEAWCTSIDWGAGTFKAMSPVIFVHGNGSDGGFFGRQGFTHELNVKGIVFDTSIELNPNTLPNGVKDTHAVAVNGRRLNELIPAIVRQLGARNIHLVVHSKGGLDTREYLAKYQRARNREFKVLSLTTLGSPHNGSVLADISIARIDALRNVGVLADNIDLENFPTYTQFVVEQIDKNGVDRGRYDLTTSFVANFNRNNVPLLDRNITFNTIAADADTNGTHSIDQPSEYAELAAESPELASQPNFIARRIVDVLYQNLRLNRTVTTRAEQRCTLGLFCKVVLVISPVPNQTPLGNDTLVTLPSATGVGSIQPLTTNTHTFSGGAGRNHSSVANQGVAQIVIPWLIQVDRTKGGLK